MANFRKIATSKSMFYDSGLQQNMNNMLLQNSLQNVVWSNFICPSCIFCFKKRMYPRRPHRCQDGGRCTFGIHKLIA